MPIISPQGDAIDPLYERLASAGAAIISEEDAVHQDIRPARIGLLNLMPAASMETTEIQWMRYLSHTVLQIEPVLIKFDKDPRDRDGGSRKDILERYQPLSQVVHKGLDGLIVTGDNLELRDGDRTKPEPLPFDEISYAPQLAEVIDWARNNVHSTIYSCLASHFLLNHLYDIPRDISPQKRLGVFEHTVEQPSRSSIVRGMDDVLRAPHSRWGNVSIAALRAAGISVLAVSEQVGWLLAEDANRTGGTDVLIQGHPEYDRHDLDTEYQRDKHYGQVEPQNYYQNNKPVLTWANDARALHANWISGIYSSFASSQ